MIIYSITRLYVYILYPHTIILKGMKEESQPCPHCGKIFSTKSSLEPHIMMVHKGVRKKCPDCGKVLSDLWKHMRTIHGHYRRRVKIPKEEAILQMTSGTNSFIEAGAEEDEFDDKISPLHSTSPIISTPPPLKKLSHQDPPVMQRPAPASKKNVKNTTFGLSTEKLVESKNVSKTSSSSLSSKNKRKNSLPLKVKMPFKISKKNLENGSHARKQAIRLSDDDVDL